MINRKRNNKLFIGAIALAIAAVSVGTITTSTTYASTTSNIINYKNANANLSGKVEERVNEFVNSITYEVKTQTLSFVVPKEIPEGYKWFVHISGHEQFSQGPGIFHLFEDESYNYTWEPGKKYEYTFKENPLINCSIEVGMVNKNVSNDIINNMIVNIDKDGNITKSKYENYEAVNNLINTINYDKASKTISFTVPQSIPDGYKWFIHISGHEQLKEGPVVFNSLEDETYNYKWESGKTYSFAIKDGELINCAFEVGFKNVKSNYIESTADIVIDKDGNKNFK